MAESFAGRSGAEHQTQGRNPPAEQDAKRASHTQERDTYMGTELTTQTSRGLALQTFDDAMRFGKLIAESEFPPKDFKGKPASCVLAIQHGAEIGLGPMQAIQSIAVINGRPTIWGDAALALVMASPVCEYVKETIEGDADQAVATCTAKRKGYPDAVVSRFSMADAKRAGLAGKQGPWAQYPKRMLQLRARGFALRDAFPDVLKGLVTAEEAQDYPLTQTPPPVVVTQPDQAVPQTTKAAAKEASSEDMQKAKLAINKARDLGKLSDFLATVNERYESGFYSAPQADELRNLIDVAMDVLQEREVTA